MSTITISPVQAEELPELLELARSTFYDAFASLNTEENMRLYMDQNQHVFMLGTDEQRDIMMKRDLT